MQKFTGSLVSIDLLPSKRWKLPTNTCPHNQHLNVPVLFILFCFLVSRGSRGGRMMIQRFLNLADEIYSPPPTPESYL